MNWSSGATSPTFFEVKARELKPPTTSIEIGSDRIGLPYQREGFVRGTTIAFSQRATVDEDRAHFDLQLEPRERWQLCVDVRCLVDGTTIEPGQRCGSFGVARPKMPMALDQWLADAPRLETDSDVVRHTYRQSLVDLAALRFRPDENVSWSLPAAGLPGSWPSSSGTA